jgi:hypothetical protein
MHEAFDLNIRPLVAVIQVFNEPGRSLQFVIEGSAGANATVLAAWIDQLCAECYVAPWDGRVTRETPADRFGGILQGG